MKSKFIVPLVVFAVSLPFSYFAMGQGIDSFYPPGYASYPDYPSYPSNPGSELHTTNVEAYLNSSGARVDVRVSTSSGDKKAYISIGISESDTPSTFSGSAQ